MRGSVKWFSDLKGFGFIRPDAGKGPLAQNVRRVNAVTASEAALPYA